MVGSWRFVRFSVSSSVMYVCSCLVHLRAEQAASQCKNEPERTAGDVCVWLRFWRDCYERNFIGFFLLEPAQRLFLRNQKDPNRTYERKRGRQYTICMYKGSGLRKSVHVGSSRVLCARDNNIKKAGNNKRNAPDDIMCVLCFQYFPGIIWVGRCMLESYHTNEDENVHSPGRD